jgi:hypothetical protein
LGVFGGEFLLANYGIDVGKLRHRMISSRVMPAYPQYYVSTIVQAVLKQLDDVQHAPTIFGR